MRSLCLIAGLALLIPPGAPAETRLKDLVTLEGMRDNQLVGYGLVVGLAGTGDKRTTVFSTQSLANMLQRMGVTVDPAAIRVNNTAAVMVTATLPAFAQPGTRMDVTASAIGDAANLQGGILILTSLRGANGQVYATAQGPVVTGGFAAGRPGNIQSVNHPTVGRVPNGAIVERPAPSVEPTDKLQMQLRNTDFTTAVRIAEAVNRKFFDRAHAENAALVSVRIPESYLHRVAEFISEIQNLEVTTDQPAKVVVNERTGTIVMGMDVHIKPTAILHGNLTVEIQTAYNVSQPNPVTSGKTEVIPQTTTTARDDKVRNIVLKEGASVEELVQALSAIGSTARDIIAILQNLRAAGALEAELEVI
jgi:flagellar P-ring protein precursor FlgI